MARVPKPKLVELKGEYYHVRFRDPDEFSEIRTPEWAQEAAAEIANGSKVRTERRKGSDDWVVQSVLIPEAAGTSKAPNAGRADHREDRIVRDRLSAMQERDSNGSHVDACIRINLTAVL
jgi:hypothetical protein